MQRVQSCNVLPSPSTLTFRVAVFAMMCFGQSFRDATLQFSLQVIKLLYANAGAFKFVKRSPLSFSKKTYIGFVAHNAESAASSEGVDVVISWRGTVTDDEWHQVSSLLLYSWRRVIPSLH